MGFWWGELCLWVILFVYAVCCLLYDCTPLDGIIREGQEVKVGEGGEVDGAVGMAMYGSMD